MTKTQGYKFGVKWVADNDDPSIRDAEQIASYISTALLADLFGKEPEAVAADILAERTRQDQAKAGTLPAPRKVRKPSGMAGQPFSQVEAEQYKRMHPNMAAGLERWPANGFTVDQMRAAIKVTKIPYVFKGVAYRYLAYLVAQAERTAADAGVPVRAD